MAQPCEELSFLLVMMGPDYRNNLDVKTKHELWFSTEDPTPKILTLSPRHIPNIYILNMIN